MWFGRHQQGLLIFLQAAPLQRQQPPTMVQTSPHVPGGPTSMSVARCSRPSTSDGSSCTAPFLASRLSEACRCG